MSIQAYKRTSAPKESIPLITIEVNDKRPDIPIKKDWSKRVCTMTASFEPYVERTLNLKVRHDDIFVITMPKCGTTWMQEAAWLVANDFDLDTAETNSLSMRSAQVE